MSTPDPHAGSERETQGIRKRAVAWREKLEAPGTTSISVNAALGMLADLDALLAAPSPSEERAEPRGRRVAYQFDPERGTTKRIVMEGGARAATLEQMAEAVHQAYLETCERLGWGVKPENQVPYAALSEDSKELDRASVRAVLRALAPASPSEPLPRGEPLDYREEFAHLPAASPSVEPPRNNAWLALKHSRNLKQCPWCGELALEGEEECSKCGARPTDDMTWRNAPAPLVQPEPQPEDTP